MLFVGLVAVGAGLYFVLVALGLVPAPGKANAPDWLVFAAGLAFALGGLGVILPRAAGVEAKDGELPKSAPRWLQVAQYLLILTILGCFGAIGTWIAVGPGPRAFTGTFPVGPVAGRIASAIGAAIVWLMLIAVAISGARRLLDRGKA
jgi:hypothetical protein